MTIYPELADDRAAGRLTTSLPEGVALDNVTWGMLTHNVIPGIARVRRAQLDDEVVLTFDAPGFPLARRMEALLRKDQVLQLLDAMVDAVLAADRHMIPTAALVYDTERVYVDDAGAVVMLCLPVEGADHGDPVAFIKRVIFNLRYDPQDDTSYVSDLINVLGGSAAGDVSRLSRLLRATRVSDSAGRGAPAQAPAPVPGTAAPGGEPWAAAPGAPEWAAPRAVAGDPARAGGPGFAVPGGAPVPTGAPTAAARATAAPADDGDEISLAYLLQHYSKENKERYERGRKARAAAKAASQPVDPAVAAPAAPPAATGAAPAGHGVPQAGVPVAGPPSPHPGAYGAVVAAPAHAAPASPPPAAAPSAAGVSPVVPQHAATPAAGVPGAHAAAAQWPDASVAAEQHPVPVAPTAADPAAHARFGLQDTSTGATTWLTKPITVLGRRRARVDIAVADDTVSKNHAIVQVDGETCSIIDNSSTNGVEVDGVRITPLETTPLRDGSRVRVGEVVLVLVDRATW